MTSTAPRGGPEPRLHVEESGPADAPLVVLVHGSMDRSGGFRRVARRLDDRFRVARDDRRGYARSRRSVGPFDLTGHVDDLLVVMGGRRGVVVGHSYGGVVALAASVRRPDLVRAVGAFEPPMPWMPWWPGTTAGDVAVMAQREGGPEHAAEAFMRRMIGDERWARLPEHTRAERRADGAALVEEMIDIRSAAPWDPADITVPVVAGHGTMGAPHHPPAVRWLVQQVPGAELVAIEEAGHGAHTSHPQEFAAFVERVVARADAAGR